MKNEYDFKKGKRGAVVKPATGKTRITIRLDTDIIDFFREQVEEAGGGSYQTLINKALREHMLGSSLRADIRQVIREEVGTYLGKKRKG